MKYMGNANVSGDYEFSGATKEYKMNWFVWWAYDGDKKVAEKLAKRGRTLKLRFTKAERGFQISASNVFDEAQLSDPTKYKYIGLYILGVENWVFGGEGR